MFLVVIEEVFVGKNLLLILSLISAPSTSRLILKIKSKSRKDSQIHSALSSLGVFTT